MSLELYFSLATSTLFLALAEEGRLLEKIEEWGEGLHGEVFFTRLSVLLSRTKKELAELERVYFTSGPGKQSGIRISLSFVLGLSILNPRIAFYHLNTLQLQAGQENCLSALSLDKKKTKMYLAVYEKQEAKTEQLVVGEEEIRLLREKHPSFVLLSDFEGIDFWERMVTQKEQFHRLLSIKSLKLSGI